SLSSCPFPVRLRVLSPCLVGASVPTACVASVYFTHAHYGAGRPGLEWAALFLLGPVVAGLARAGVVSPAMSAAVIWVVLALAVVHQIDFLARLAARRAMNARLLLGGWILIGAGEAIDLAAGLQLS